MQVFKLVAKLAEILTPVRYILTKRNSVSISFDVKVNKVLDIYFALAELSFLPDSAESFLKIYQMLPSLLCTQLKAIGPFR